MRCTTTSTGPEPDYAMAMLDSDKQALDGSKTYKLNLPADIPVVDFWAVTMYDTQTRSQLQTDQQFPTLDTYHEGLATNDDGSIDIYFSPTPPEGNESNWLQTVPGKGWFIALRLYGPTEPWIDQSWRPGEVELVDWSGANDPPLPPFRHPFGATHGPARAARSS